MAEENTDDLALTQRAYTLRLFPAIARDDSPEGIREKTQAMQDALWATHEAVNKGAKVFGDWLLTLRGGLDHKLAGDPNPEKRRNRRILLALGWLSVEDERGAPADPRFRVASGRDRDDERRAKLAAALEAILSARGMAADELGSWLTDCIPSLSARIRDDAVWINRSALFDGWRNTFGADRDYAQTTIFHFFGPAAEYFSLPTAGENGELTGVTDEGPEFRTTARQWVSTNFGTGDKSETEKIRSALKKIAEADLVRFEGHPKAELLHYLTMLLGGKVGDDAEDALRSAVGWITGRPSKARLAVRRLPDPLTKDSIEVLKKKCKEEADEKEAEVSTRSVLGWMARFRKELEAAIGLPYVVGRDLIGEYSVMLDHAARRVSMAHSWIKRAEAARQRFTEDVAKISHVPSPAKQWLDQFCAERSESTAAIGAYRIRPRAIQGWDAIVRRWSRTDCETEEDRITVARTVQDDPEIEKFGDIQLFEALAADDAVCVWKPEGKPDPDPLKSYVAASHAAERQRRFKVPAYRHPDPLRHPVFCDFGNSRWDIRFAVHEREKSRRKGIRARKNDSEWQKDTRGLRMILWTGRRLEPVSLRWACKRLSKDFAFDGLGSSGSVAVTRADRLGRAASAAKEPVTIRNVFDERDWNGRLQAPRAQLDRIASLMERNRTAEAEILRRRLGWLVSFSPRLCPVGPFIEFAGAWGIQPNRRGEYYPHAEQNKNDGRRGHAKLVLSRLPGLRVLSVDLGHRFAAACAVWEALDARSFDMGKAIAAAKAEGATVEGSPDDLYVHILRKRQQEQGDHKREIEETTVYRRIGTDLLPDGKPHPAPWARLERQFLIKLQGEERPARAASTEELAKVEEFARRLGLTNPDLPRRVDELMREAVRVARLALGRHARRARIAWGLDPRTTTVFGMGGRETPFQQGDETHIKLLTDTLFDWHALASDFRWSDPEARRLWNNYIQPLAGAWPIADSPSVPAATDDRSRRQRRKDDDALRQRLKPVAEALAQTDRAAMCGAWKQRWQDDDGPERSASDYEHRVGVDKRQRPISTTTPRRPTSGWHADLRWLTDWITGRRPPVPSQARNNGWKQNVGGLSLTRIATMRSLYQLHKAFAMRSRPERPRGAPEKGESNTGVAQSLLDAMERMREQRVKQLASRIVEAALGVGRMNRSADRDRKRPQEQVDAPCHAVVIESLRYYRPDQLRTRRENRALMNWSAGKVRKYLEEACQLYGLHLRDREILPNYTSRQCSRTGLPGIRCVDVPVKVFLEAPRWRKTVRAAKNKLSKFGDRSKLSAPDSFFLDVDERWSQASTEELARQKVLRLPADGGDLFVPALPWDQWRRLGTEDHAKWARRALQADLNAAANIGLRALLDPDFPGKWWYVPCSSKNGRPAQDKVSGAACLDPEACLLAVSEKSAAKRDYANAWRDPSAADIRRARDGWLETIAYWNHVSARALAVLRHFNGLADR